MLNNQILSKLFGFGNCLNFFVGLIPIFEFSLNRHFETVRSVEIPSDLARKYRFFKIEKKLKKLNSVKLLQTHLYASPQTNNFPVFQKLKKKHCSSIRCGFLARRSWSKFLRLSNYIRISSNFLTICLLINNLLQPPAKRTPTGSYTRPLCSLTKFRP